MKKLFFFVLNHDVFLSLKAVLIFANSEDSDEKQHYAAFHLGLHWRQITHAGVSSIQRINLYDKVFATNDHNQ